MKELSKYCKELIKKTNHFANLVLKDFEVKDVHQLRVEIKKLKAFIHMMLFKDNEMNEKLLKKLKEISGGIGTIRDRQLLMAKINASKFADKEIKDEIIELLQSEEKEAHKKFKKHFEKSGQHVLKEAENSLLKTVDDSNDAELSNYFNSMITDAIGKFHQNDLSDKQYHELRMRLKDLKYNLNQFPDEFKKNLKEIPDERELNKLEKILGQWHDYVVMVQLVDHAAASEGLSSKSIEYLHKMKSSSEEKGKQFLFKAKKYFRHEQIVFH